MQLQRLIWNMAMLFFIIMIIVNVGVHAGGGQSCNHKGKGDINCQNGGEANDELAPLPDALESVANEW